MRKNHRFARGGFTLIEVLIVLAIVLALSALIGVSLFSRQDDAKLQLAQTDLNTIESGMKLFRLDLGRFPTEEEGIAVLWDSEVLDADTDEAAWKGPYLEEPMPLDRWDNEWGYRAESEYDRDYDLWSNGPDGEEDTEDDITSWSSGSDEEDDFGAPMAPAPGDGGGSSSP